MAFLVLFPLFPSCVDDELGSNQAIEPRAQPDEWKNPGHKDRDEKIVFKLSLDFTEQEKYLPLKEPVSCFCRV